MRNNHGFLLTGAAVLVIVFLLAAVSVAAKYQSTIEIPVPVIRVTGL